MTRLALVIAPLLSACPPGTGAAAVSCVPDGSTSLCLEWVNADLPTLGAVDLTCAQLGASLTTQPCPTETRQLGCRLERGAIVETKWSRLSTEVVPGCEDAGRRLVDAASERDAGGPEPADAGPRCSLPSLEAATLIIANVGSETLFLRWVTQSCTETSYPTLAPGSSLVQPTFVGHVWRVRRGGPTGPLVREFMVEATNASVAVR